MSEHNVLKDWLKENGGKLKIVYSYAVVNNLNINSRENVLKILQAIDPENANLEQVETYIKMLQLFKDSFRKTIGDNLKY